MLISKNKGNKWICGEAKTEKAFVIFNSFLKICWFFVKSVKYRFYDYFCLCFTIFLIYGIFSIRYLRMRPMKLKIFYDFRLLYVLPVIYRLPSSPGLHTTSLISHFKRSFLSKRMFYQKNKIILSHILLQYPYYYWNTFFALVLSSFYDLYASSICICFIFAYFPILLGSERHSKGFYWYDVPFWWPPPATATAADR